MWGPVDLQPFVEMIRLIGVGTHVARPDIEEMVGVPCGEGESSADFLALFDQYDLGEWTYTAEETGSENGSAGAATNDAYP